MEKLLLPGSNYKNIHTFYSYGFVIENIWIGYCVLARLKSVKQNKMKQITNLVPPKQCMLTKDLEK